MLAACVPLLAVAAANADSPTKTASDDGLYWKQDAQSLLARRKWAQAAVALRTEVHRDPRSLSANADLAKALLYLHHRDEAVGILQRAIQLNKGRRQTWLIDQLRVISKVFLSNSSFQSYQDGVDLLTARRYRAAREKLEQALAAEPNNVEVLTRLGQSYLLDEENESAMQRLKAARQLDPYEPEIHLWLGRTLALGKDKAQGLQELQAAAGQLSQSELAPIWLAEALAAAGQREGAISVLEADVKGNPIHVAALMELANLRIRDPDASRDDLWSARKDFQNALSRLADYEQPGRRRFEGELGVEILRSGPDLRREIQSQLQKLESRLEAESGL